MGDEVIGTTASARVVQAVVEEEFVVHDPLSQEFYAVYRDAFDPLAPEAAARHVLDEEEWKDEMADERILKLIAKVDGNAVGLATVALDIEAVPWASARFYQRRYPGRQIYYTGFAAVLPEYQRSTVFEALLRHGLRRALTDNAVCAYDCSSFVQVIGFPDMINRVTAELTHGGGFTPVDTQTYFVFDTQGQEVIDLREHPSESGLPRLPPAD